MPIVSRMKWAKVICHCRVLFFFVFGCKSVEKLKFVFFSFRWLNTLLCFFHKIKHLFSMVINLLQGICQPKEACQWIYFYFSVNFKLPVLFRFSPVEHILNFWSLPIVMSQTTSDFSARYALISRPKYSSND